MSLEELIEKWRPLLLAQADTPEKILKLLSLSTDRWGLAAFVVDNLDPFALIEFGMFLGAEWQSQQQVRN